MGRIMHYKYFEMLVSKKENAFYYKVLTEHIFVLFTS